MAPAVHWHHIKIRVGFFPPGAEADGTAHLALARGIHELYSGAAKEARASLKVADPNSMPTKLATALMETWSGDPHRAIQLTNEVRQDTLELRRADLWRIAIAAQAHLRLGDEAAIINVLKEIQNFPEPLRPREIAFFTDDIGAIAQAKLDWWPAETVPTDAYFNSMPEREAHLTEREVEVLRLLARGLTRPQIAEELFVTLNTLKTQLRTVYRKLRAESKAEALQRAMARGLI